MSDLILFLIGLGVSSVVATAVGILVWGASQERYVSGRHRGGDLLRVIDRAVDRRDEPSAPTPGTPSEPLVPELRATATVRPAGTVTRTASASDSSP